MASKRHRPARKAQRRSPRRDPCPRPAPKPEKVTSEDKCPRSVGGDGKP